MTYWRQHGQVEDHRYVRRKGYDEPAQQSDATGVSSRREALTRLALSLEQGADNEPCWLKPRASINVRILRDGVEIDCFAAIAATETNPYGAAAADPSAPVGWLAEQIKAPTIELINLLARLEACSR